MAQIVMADMVLAYVVMDVTIYALSIVEKGILVMAYIVMAQIVMADMVLAYAVMDVTIYALSIDEKGMATHTSTHVPMHMPMHMSVHMSAHMSTVEKGWMSAEAITTLAITT